MTCGDLVHPVLVLRAGEESNCFQQLGGVGGRTAARSARGCSEHTSLLNKHLLKCVLWELKEQEGCFFFFFLQVGARFISTPLPSARCGDCEVVRRVTFVFIGQICSLLDSRLSQRVRKGTTRCWREPDFYRAST